MAYLSNMTSYEKSPDQHGNGTDVGQDNHQYRIGLDSKDSTGDVKAFKIYVHKNQSMIFLCNQLIRNGIKFLFPLSISDQW